MFFMTRRTFAPYRFLLSSLFLFWLFMIGKVLAEEGDLAADFTLPHLSTKTQYTLSDYRGSVVLVDFWASWCGPCRASFPAYEKIRQKLQATYGETSFEILAINVDMEKDEAFAFLKTQPVSFPILEENTGGKTQHDYQILAMPTAFLIDPEGRIRMQHSGFNSAYAELIVDTAAEMIEALPED